MEAILQLKPPTTRKQLRRFKGMVNYYRDMWPKRSHLLAPLSTLTLSQVKLKWSEEHQQSFDQTFNSEQVMCWRLYIEEYSPDLQYIKGTHNVVADALSRVDINEEPLEDSTKTFLGLLDCFTKTKQTKEIEDFQPLNYLQLQKAQENDKSMMKLLKDDDTAYVLKEFYGGGKTISLVTYKDKIVIPQDCKNT
jgi:hypothetical protein